MTDTDINREQWLRNAREGFVTSAPANRNYYRLILETLWPPEHTIPGPVVFLSDIRQVIDNFRGVGKPYQDVPRRIRELQGEEGFLGIKKYGNGQYTRYQLVSLEISPKRIQRVKLSDTFWERILTKYQHRCAVCGRTEPAVILERDHKIPRLRGGSNEEDNWQPLCGECNNFKSTACRGCQLECNQCPWAFPERLAPIKISERNIQGLRDIALQKGVSPDSLVNELIEGYLEEQS
ncbi:MAG: HNH endonuclease [Oscillatoria sp. SIO1A7]|nr:HNH endonuclease [Oscillatoria sp. SIO1A7]